MILKWLDGVCAGSFAVMVSTVAVAVYMQPILMPMCHAAQTNDHTDRMNGVLKSLTGCADSFASMVSTIAFAFYIQPIAMPMLREMPPGKRGYSILAWSMRLVIGGVGGCSHDHYTCISNLKLGFLCLYVHAATLSLLGPYASSLTVWFPRPRQSMVLCGLHDV